MATGYYQCSSNRARIADEDIIRGLLQRYNTHNQVTLHNGQISVESPSDSFSVTLDGSGAEIVFLKDIAPHLEESLRINNVLDHPYAEKEEFTFVARPDGTVLRRETDGEEKVL